MNMDITVKSYHSPTILKDCLSEQEKLSLPTGTTVGGALLFLGLPPEELPKLVLYVNGRMASEGTPLSDGDTLIFFSPVAGG
jgi:molybdopterin converting factor small subunit